tara:strand:+ start:294 stop:734 length:441 start_codon:yes stop_codon:yes gene_type:complete
MSKTIKIEVNAGCVTEVTGLPEGYDYEIVDHDSQEKEAFAAAKTHVIKDDGTVTVIEGKIEHLDEMQKLVKGPIEIVNAAMPAASPELPGSEALKEMVVNEEGLFNGSFKTNQKARELIAQGLQVQLDAIQDIRGDVFVTDGWRIE